MRSILINALIFLSLCATFGACKGMERSKEATAEIEAAQVEGRNEAKRYLNRPWNDTVDLQNQLLESRAKKSKYEMAGKPKSAAAYDSAFISTLRTVRPELVREIEAVK